MLAGPLVNTGDDTLEKVSEIEIGIEFILVLAVMLELEQNIFMDCAVQFAQFNLKLWDFPAPYPLRMLVRVYICKGDRKVNVLFFPSAFGTQ